MSLPRDAPSLVIDGSFDPVLYIKLYINEGVARAGLVGSRLTNARAHLLSAEETLDEAALDRYIAIRSAYLDRREFLVHDGLLPPDEDLIEELRSLA
jgi:phospholipid-binding lipoprotein MlaA